MPSALVVYGTRHGSTRQVAERVGEALSGRGVVTVVRPARTVRHALDPCDLVVVGAALYSGRWLRDAHRFLQRHRDELAGLPVAAFGLGPRTLEPTDWQRSRAQLERALAKHPWLHPRAVAVFGGADPMDGRRHHRDLRDWPRIRAWAVDLTDLVDKEGIR